MNRSSVGFFTLLIMLNLSSPLRAQAQVVVEKIVATVNDEIITKTDLEKYKSKIKNSALQDELFGTTPDDLLKDEKKLLNQLIDERLVDSEVTRQSLGVTFERVEEEVKQKAKENNLTRAQLKQALQEQGVDFAEYQDFMKKRLERQSLIQKAITSKIRISDEDVANYYTKTSKKDLKQAYEFTLSHILLRAKGSSGESGALKRAETVAAKIKAGESFEELTSQFSEDPNYQKGGFLGKFKSGEFIKELEAGIQDLKEGEVSGIIKTKLGYHLVKINKKVQISDPDFEKNKEQIRGLLSQKAFEKQFQFWLSQRRKEANIRFN